MKSKILLFLFLMLIGVYAHAQIPTIYFETNSSSLSEEAKTTLTKFSEKLLAFENPQKIQVTITGYTDADGTPQANRELSLLRARTVAQYLQEKKVPYVFSLFSEGESNPVNNNTTDQEKALNRRVTLTYAIGSNELSELDNLVKTQTFRFTQNRDTVFIGEGGTLIGIKKNSFNVKDPGATMVLKVKEYLTKKDFVLGNLTSLTTHQQLLASKGMLFVEALEGDREATLKPGAEISFVFKNRTDGDGTKLYSGIETPNGIVWTDENTPDGEDFENVVFVQGKLKIARDSLASESNYDTALRTEYRIIDNKPYKINYRTDTTGVTTDTLSAEKFTTEDYQSMAFGKLSQKMNSLHYINCDAFYNNNNPKTCVTIQLDTHKNAKVFLVFKNVNGIMPYSGRENNLFMFNNVPTETSVTVIAVYEDVGSGQLWFGTAVGKIVRNYTVPLTVTSTDIDTFLKQLEAL